MDGDYEFTPAIEWSVKPYLSLVLTEAYEHVDECLDEGMLLGEEITADAPLHLIPSAVVAAVELLKTTISTGLQFASDVHPPTMGRDAALLRQYHLSQGHVPAVGWISPVFTLADHARWPQQRGETANIGRWSMTAGVEVPWPAEFSLLALMRIMEFRKPAVADDVAGAVEAHEYAPTPKLTVDADPFKPYVGNPAWLISYGLVMGIWTSLHLRYSDELRRVLADPELRATAEEYVPLPAGTPVPLPQLEARGLRGWPYDKPSLN